MIFKVQKSECSVSEPLFVYSFQGCSKDFVPGGECLTHKTFPSRVVARKKLGLLGVQGHAPPKKIQNTGS